MTTAHSVQPTNLLLILRARDADRTTMQTYMRVLKQRVRESRYVVDERAVAEAILTHARIRLTADLTKLQQRPRGWSRTPAMRRRPSRSARSLMPRFFKPPHDARQRSRRPLGPTRDSP